MVKVIIFDIFGVIYDLGVNYDLLDYIKGLRKKYKVAVLSNSNRELLLAQLSEIDIEKRFDHLLFSSDLEVQKPSIEIFRKAVKVMEIDPQECIFIDDSEMNVESAKRSGMIGIVYDNNTQLKEVLEEMLGIL